MNLSPLLIAVVLGVGTTSCQMTTNSESRTGNLESENLTTGLEGRTMIASPCPSCCYSRSYAPAWDCTTE